MRSVDQAGFTLVEVMAVMAIIALMASLVLTMTPGTGRSGLEALAMQVTTLLRHERLAAILSGHDHAVALDPRQHALSGSTGETIVVPQDVEIAMLGIGGDETGAQSKLQFHPDGASSGAVLRLSGEGARYEIRVNWFTGSVVLAER